MINALQTPRLAIVLMISALFCGYFCSETRAAAPEPTTESPLKIPQPFKVIYKADYKGLPISATGIRELTLSGETQQPIYTLASSALSIFAKLTEQSDFILKDGIAQPISYRYDRTGLGRNKSLRLDFDWNQRQVKNLDSGQAWQLPDQTLSDRLLYQFQLQTDLLNLGSKVALGHQLQYRIQDKNQVKDYHFTVRDRVVLQTPLGPIDTYEIIRSNAERRTTTLWLAPSHEYMLIRFEQSSNDGENFSLALKTAEINKQPLLSFEPKRD